MYVELSENDFFSLLIGGSKGARDAPEVQILSFSCSFRQKIWKIIALLGVGAPPAPQENPESATVSGEKMKKKNYVEWREVKNLGENNLNEEMLTVIAIVIMGEAVDLKPYEIKEFVVPRGLLLDPPLGRATQLEPSSWICTWIQFDSHIIPHRQRKERIWGNQNCFVSSSNEIQEDTLENISFFAFSKTSR